MDKDQIQRLQQIVEWADGIWVGVQEGDGMYTDLVLFNSRQTSSTLALPANEFFTVQAVKEKIAASNKLFGIGEEIGRENEPAQ
jgi:hypothetical protein